MLQFVPCRNLCSQWRALIFFNLWSNNTSCYLIHTGSSRNVEQCELQHFVVLEWCRYEESYIWAWFCVVWEKFISASEQPAASIFRVESPEDAEAATCSETSASLCQITRMTSQKTVILVFSTLKTSNPSSRNQVMCDIMLLQSLTFLQKKCSYLIMRNVVK